MLHRISRIGSLHHHAFKELAAQGFVGRLEALVERQKFVVIAPRQAGGEQERRRIRLVDSARKPLLRNAQGFKERPPLLVARREREAVVVSDDFSLNPTLALRDVLTLTNQQPKAAAATGSSRPDSFSLICPASRSFCSALLRVPA